MNTLMILKCLALAIVRIRQDCLGICTDLLDSWKVSGDFGGFHETFDILFNYFHEVFTDVAKEKLPLEMKHRTYYIDSLLKTLGYCVYFLRWVHGTGTF